MKKILSIALFISLAFTSAFAGDEVPITSQDLCPMTAGELQEVNTEEGRDRIVFEEYTLALACVKEREMSAQAKATELESQIADLRQQVADTKQAVSDKWAEMLAYVGITQDEYDAFVASIDAFISKVNGFESQFADDFKAWASALADGDKEYEEIKSNKIAVFPRLDSKIAAAGQALEDSKSALAAAKNANNMSSGGTDTYTVRLIPERRDCLWRIAEYQDVYGDPFRWPEIYSANTDQIKDPDLIFPGQVFTIPR